MLLADDFAHAFMPYPPVSVPGPGHGPLQSLTFGVKDIFDVAGYRTACGNPVKLAESPIAAEHTPAAAALLAAGAQFVGKTHTEELAWSLYGTNAHFGAPLNPAAPDRVPGGSSSGSASAVAARLCDFALGSDTGGSVRAPASFCGLFGLRPSHGAIPLDRCMPLAPSFDTCGFFARDAATLKAVGDVLLPKAAATASRVMIARDLFARLPAGVRDAIMPMAEKLQAALGKATPVDVYDRPTQQPYDAFRILQLHEAGSLHGPWVDSRKPVLGPTIAMRFVAAKKVTDEQVAAARAARASFAAHLETLYGADGLMIAPVLHGPAPRLDADAAALEAYRDEAMVFLCPAGLAGLPQLVLPAGSVDGAPVGISILGPRGSDRALLDAAARLAA
ncbi:MAG TPA: amidase [Rhodoblastus sp.]|nr:amidase [Rhodoblastus sp.]